MRQTPVGILVTVALLAMCGAYAIWSAILERSLLYALVGAVAVVACVATARLVAWSRYLVYLLTAVFIGSWAYSVYAAASVGYFSQFSAAQIARSLAAETLLVALSCFCCAVVFRRFRPAT